MEDRGIYAMTLEVMIDGQEETVAVPNGPYTRWITIALNCSVPDKDKIEQEGMIG